MELIALADALKEMDKKDTKGKPIPFSVSFCTYNRFTKEGGARISIDKAILYNKKHVKKETVTTKSKIPNHFDNGTRNILIMPSGEIRKMHIRLIEKFNGKIVFY